MLRTRSKPQAVKLIAQLGDIADAQCGVAPRRRRALERFGRIDILVNNAALRRDTPFEQIDHAEWRAIMDVTLDLHFPLR